MYRLLTSYYLIVIFYIPNLWIMNNFKLLIILEIAIVTSGYA